MRERIKKIWFVYLISIRKRAKGREEIRKIKISEW